MHRESRQPRLSCRWSTPQSLQAFVFFAVASELSLGLHDLMLSGCAYSPERHRQKQLGAMSANFGADTPSAGAAFLDGAEPGPAESFEFFVWSRCSFVATFVGMYALSPRLNAGLRDLLSGRISNKYIALSAFSEGLTIVGFYLASIAYGLFYQVTRSICVAPAQPRHRSRLPPLTPSRASTRRRALSTRRRPRSRSCSTCSSRTCYSSASR